MSLLVGVYILNDNDSINYLISKNEEKKILDVTQKIIISYSLCPIRNETFSFLVCPVKNETFLKIETTLSLLFLISYFTLSSLTHKTTLPKILCRKSNVAYLMGRREYILIKLKKDIKFYMYLFSTNKDYCFFHHFAMNELILSL